MRDAIAGRAEHQRAGRVVIAQQVDDDEVALARHAGHRVILDVAMDVVRRGRLDPQRVLLVALRHHGDRLRDRRREHQRAAVRRRGIEDSLEVLAEPHVEHLVGLVEHDGLEPGGHEHAALEVIAEPSGRADHDMDAVAERLLLAARIHTADAGRDPRAGLAIQPAKLAMNLKCELAGRAHDECAWRTGSADPVAFAEQPRCDREAEGHGLARAGLRGHQQVAFARAFGEHRGLDRRRINIVFSSESAPERRMGRRERQDFAHPSWSGVRTQPPC